MVQIKQYFSKEEFMKDLAKVTEKIDTVASLKLVGHSLADKDGKHYRANKLAVAVKLINAIEGSAVINASKSRAFRNQNAMSIGWTNLPTEVIVVDEENVNIETEDVTSVTDPNVEPAWAWIESLENTAEDKLLLDKYAEDKFSIKLTRTMKLSNMIKKFKEELA